MPLENVDFIEDLIPTNPVGATDPKSEGDDHIRNIKKAILANLPNLGREAARMSASQMNGFTGMLGEFPAEVTEGIATGWLRCNGQAVLRADYPDLFAMLGVIYGPGNGTTNFVLPDYRGRFKRDTDQGAGNDPNADIRTDRGDGTDGDVVGTKQGQGNDAHSHANSLVVTDPDHGHGASQPAHGHAATQAGHIHGATQGTHSHSILTHDENGNNGGRVAVTSSVDNFGGSTEQASAGAITIDSQAPVITVPNATPAVNVVAGPSGVTVELTNANAGGSESRPINANVLTYIHV